jgi:hypothetical protein
MVFLGRLTDESLPLAMTSLIARLVQVLAAAAVVVNDHDLGNVIALPARSFTPVVIVAICLVEKAKFEDGLKLAVLPSELRDTVPTTFLVVAGVVVVFSLFNVKVVAVIVELFIGSLNVAVIDALKIVFILRIKELETYLEESRKLYNLTNESDYVLRSTILREINSIGISLAMLKNKHQLWKQHKVTISK